MFYNDKCKNYVECKLEILMTSFWLAQAFYVDFDTYCYNLNLKLDIYW